MRERRRRRRRPRSSTSPSRVLSGARGRKSSRAAALPRYVRETLNQIIADYTGQMQSKVEDDCDRDFFMTPEEAVECVASRSRPAAFGAPSLSSSGAHSYGIIDSVIATGTSEILKPPMPRLQDVV